MINRSYFIDENIKTGFKIILESPSIIHAKSNFTVAPIYPGFDIETRCINKIVKEMATLYARLLNQYRYEYHILISTSFYEINEEGQRSDEMELFINLNIFQNVIETDIDNIDVKSQLEHQFQIQETKDSGWIFDKINSRKKRLSKTGELNGSSYFKNPLRSNAI